ncbi:MAG: hypothetical protein ACP5SD_02585 [Elusimicrobiales bacterium]|nr:flagellin [Elusimicrobiales bacterium]
MRITESMINRNSLSCLNKNMSELYSSSNKISTGKQVNLPSDAPSKIKSVSEYKLSLKSNEQYEKNINFLLSRTELYNSSFDTIYSQLSIIKEKISLSGAISSQEVKNNIIEEIDLSIKNIAFTLNKKDGKNYIFSGTDGNSKSVELTYDYDPDGIKRISGWVYGGNEGKNYVRISDYEKETADINAGDILKFSGQDIIENLVNLRKDIIQSNDISSYHDKINSYLDHLNDFIINNGSKIQNLNSKLDMIKRDNLSLSSFISDICDTDYSREITEYTNLKNKYDMSLKVLADLNNKNLSDFL